MVWDSNCTAHSCKSLQRMEEVAHHWQEAPCHLDLPPTVPADGTQHHQGPQPPSTDCFPCYHPADTTGAWVRIPTD